MRAHGNEDMSNALRVSCNVYFAQLGLALGPDSLERTIKDYRLIDCPPLATIAEDLPDCAYGQGKILVTPYQMACVAQTIANHGVLLAPAYGVAVTSTGVRVLADPQAAELTQMMERVVTSGTAQGVFDGLGFSVAGKTGSAQTQAGVGTTHSWFVGFAPADNPSIAFSCIVEHGGYGRIAAAAVCRSMAQKALR
jgi:peptidoglycan glycosyltransferase